MDCGLEKAPAPWADNWESEVGDVNSLEREGLRARLRSRREMYSQRKDTICA
jgi:hypothetical protein